jgi:myosin heavy subunit
MLGYIPIIQIYRLDGISDLLMLGDLNEGGLLHNIRVRYSQDKVYTAIGGPIIISVNPYKQLDIYTKDLVHKYKKTIGQMRSGVK